MKYRRGSGTRPPPSSPLRPKDGALIDLHLHSRFSDGALSPTDLVRRAREAGVSILSLTDHDSVRGLPEAREACRAEGLTLITGIELGVGLGDDEIHILGYGIDARSRQLQNVLDHLAGERLVRMEKMIEALGRLGIPLTIEDVQVETGGDIVGRLHLASALVRLGHSANHQEAFQRWIGSGRPAYVQRRLLSLREAIDLIRESGGVAVLAHPGLTRRDELIEYLVRLGVRGLEVYNPKHDFVDISRYLKMCAKYDLFATGGSDYHGVRASESLPGSGSTPADQFQNILKHINI